MAPRFEELAWHETPMGLLTLRRRVDPLLKVDVYEVKLGDEFLMSSLFTKAEVELARLSLAAVGDAELDVVVGGLGLGYTAQAVLGDPRVRSLLVVEALDEVIDWHERELLPDTAGLAADARLQLAQASFFDLVDADSGLDPNAPARHFHAILVDIDHSPRHFLHPSHATFYTPSGLRRLARHLQRGGVFGLWSDDPPDGDFMSVLNEVFSQVEAHVVSFPNPFTRTDSTNTVYVGS
jgi:spermidine synthase